MDDPQQRAMTSTFNQRVEICQMRVTDRSLKLSIAKSNNSGGTACFCHRVENRACRRARSCQVRVQIVTEWTGAVHTSHMSKAVMQPVSKDVTQEKPASKIATPL